MTAPATADLAAVLAAVALDARASDRVREGHSSERDAMARLLVRAPLYIALARAVVAERAAQAELDGLIDSRIYPEDDVYHRRDAARAAVTAALAGLAEGLS